MIQQQYSLACNDSRNILISRGSEKSNLALVYLPCLLWDWWDMCHGTNRGAQSTVKTAGREKITISGAGLGSTYEFEQFHFHWNLDTMEGSEHTIDGRGYPVEIHLVHRNTKYSSVQDALTQPDGLAVIGVVFELAPDDNPFFEEFYSTFSSITEAESDFTLTDPATLLIDFLPEDISRFYRYRGSLTTPPFNEVVDWIVMEDTLPLSEAQINKFGELLDSEGSSIRFNDREVQPIKDREIYRRSGKKYSTRDWFMLLQNKSG
ncbi:carbonic anhydrase 2-like [Artemia franciscana]|uniref:carbonic anhydrase 2-like n=1 Tax=Artemia franciscana TaxID=6661 RepID=UPI0032DB8F63